MKIVILTTKDYYSFAESEYWECVDCGLIKPFISSFYKDAIESEDEALECFFSKAAAKSDKADDFWVKKSGKDLKILKRNLYDSVVYVLPCIPEYHWVLEDRLCYEMKLRQDFVGNFVKTILEDLGEGVLPDDILLILHDRDIFAKSKSDGDERYVKPNEIVRKSVLGELVSEKKIRIGNIYGFQHDYDPEEWRVYSLIAEKGKLLEKEPIDDFVEKLNRKMKLNNELNSY